jgi:hypothetical protein
MIEEDNYTEEESDDSANDELILGDERSLTMQNKKSSVVQENFSFSEKTIQENKVETVMKVHEEVQEPVNYGADHIMKSIMVLVLNNDKKSVELNPKIEVSLPDLDFIRTLSEKTNTDINTIIDNVFNDNKLVGEIISIIKIDLVKKIKEDGLIIDSK